MSGIGWASLGALVYRRMLLWFRRTALRLMRYAVRLGGLARGIGWSVRRHWESRLLATHGQQVFAR